MERIHLEAGVAGWSCIPQRDADSLNKDSTNGWRHKDVFNSCEKMRIKGNLDISALESIKFSVLPQHFVLPSVYLRFFYICG